jgi:hypothetical protein
VDSHKPSDVGGCIPEEPPVGQLLRLKHAVYIENLHLDNREPGPRRHIPVGCVMKYREYSIPVKPDI